MRRSHSLLTIVMGVLFVLLVSAMGFAQAKVWNFEDSSTEGLTFHGVPEHWRVVVDPLARSRVLQIVTNSYRTQTNLRGLGTYALAEGEFADVTVEVDLRFSDISNSGSAGIIVGYQDDLNYYYIYFHPTDPKIRINNAGSLKDLVLQKGGPLVKHGAYYSAKVVRQGAQIMVYLNDELIMQAEDDTFKTGRVGVGSWNHSTYFDNLSVTQ